MEQEVIYDDDNLQQRCRWDHDIKTDNENDRLLLRQLAVKVMQRSMQPNQGEVA